MSKPWKKKPKKARRHKGPCYHEGCKRNGGIIHHCITCEKLAAAGKIDPDKIYRVQCCDTHAFKALERIKHHALIGHPVNILRATIAGLKGEL